VTLVVALALVAAVLPVSAQEPAAPAQPPTGTTTTETAPADDVQWGPIEEARPPRHAPSRPPAPQQLREPAPPASEIEIPVPPAPPAQGRDRCQAIWSPAGTSAQRALAGQGCTEAQPKPETPPESPGGVLRNADGSPTVANPGFVDALPGPSVVGGVPNFVIRKFRVPPFLLSIYQAAGIEYGVRWEVLAAINEIETDYGRNLNVSTAGALGWMQFMPATWRQYGTDANEDGRKDPYNPVDAIFAAARYLKAAGYGDDVRQAIFAYNHADWYVDSVLLRARLIAGVPADLIGSLTGLTEGRFPVYARARYADDLAEQGMVKRVKAGENAANVVESDATRRGIDIYAHSGAPVVAVNDGVVKTIGHNRRLGRFLVLQDVYGNQYTYGHLGSVARYYPVPKSDTADPGRDARALKANQPNQPADPKPAGAASAGSQPADSDRPPANKTRTPAAASAGTQASVPVKERLFANPDMPQARASGGLEQLLDAKALKGKYTTYRNYFSRPFGLDASKVRLRALKKGSHVIGGTILGRIGHTTTKAPHLQFEIRPAGKGAPRVDPKPILDGWKLLEATAIYRASGRNVLHGPDSDGMSIGQILLLPKPALERRVLADERIDIYPGGQDDIRSGQIDRRVLATLEYLAESGLKPTVSCLKTGHSYRTTSGNVSEHSSGNAVDIAAINDIPIIGHQEPGGITDQTIRRLMLLQGTTYPHQIISLLDYGHNTLAMADHNDHIHIGYQPLFGANTKHAKQTLATLKPRQWTNLIDRLGEIDNPVVPTEPSKYAIPTEPGKRASDAHSGE
jgi:murein DD-endopeptidase MepM/ murein hydrolase activator NlpD